MGSISKGHQAELDAIADKAVNAWEWEVGSDTNPHILDQEDLYAAYLAVRDAIRYDLDRIAKRVGTAGHSESYLRGSLFPNVWKTISARGVLSDFDANGRVVAATPKHLIARLFLKDQEARQLYDRWQANNNRSRYDKRVGKQASQVVWNQAVVDGMNEAALELLWKPRGSSKDILGQLAAGLQWFAGRRPWAELCLRGDFQPTSGPEWADGWLLFSGHAKQTLAEKLGEEEGKVYPIPLFKISAADFMEAFTTFRGMQAGEPWFQPENLDRGHYLVKDAIYYSVRKVLDEGPLSKAFYPVLNAGYDFDLTMHRFRDLYASRGHHYQQEWCLENGMAPSNINAWAKEYLGHFGLKSEQDTGEYLRLTFLGARPIPELR
jgi:hypothetical protein